MERALTMFIAGLALGAGSMTLYWVGQMNRQFRAQARWKALVDKQNKTLIDQSDVLRNLTKAFSIRTPPPGITEE